MKDGGQRAARRPRPAQRVVLRTSRRFRGIAPPRHRLFSRPSRPSSRFAVNSGAQKCTAFVEATEASLGTGAPPLPECASSRRSFHSLPSQPR